MLFEQFDSGFVIYFINVTLVSIIIFVFNSFNKFHGFKTSTSIQV